MGALLCTVMLVLAGCAETGTRSDNSTVTSEVSTPEPATEMEPRETTPEQIPSETASEPPD